MSITVERFLSNLEPGDFVNVDGFEDDYGPDLRRDLLEELEGRGFVLDSRNILGEVSFCVRCEGVGEIKGKCCSLCDGHATTVDFGRGVKPYKS